MKLFEIISVPALMGALIGTVNLLVEVMKRCFPIKDAKKLVLCVSIALSIAVSILACVLQGWTMWYWIALSIVCGVIIGALVAYAAMFGYDDLYKQALSILEGLVGYLIGGDKKVEIPDAEITPIDTEKEAVAK